MIMISKYSKQKQISSNMVIYFSFEYLTRTKRKGDTVHIKTEAKKHTSSKGQLIVERPLPRLKFCKQVIPLIPSKCKAMKYRKS